MLFADFQKKNSDLSNNQLSGAIPTTLALETTVVYSTLTFSNANHFN
jgi:hypothetical protein